jgi:hypothetical protein
MRIFATASLAFLISSQTLASLPPSKPTIETVLAKKSAAKFDELRAMGPHIYGDLRKIAFDDARTLGVRWQAFMAMVRLGEKESLPEVDSALRSRDWFLRDAALKVLPVLDRDRAYKAAMDKLTDSALVVRTSAVDALAQLKDPRAADKLWTQLYSKENYIRHESLWIRRHIVAALADVAPAGSEGRFIRILDDADSSLFAPAIHGLERITKKKLGDENIPPVYRRYYWKKWYKENFQTAKKSS